MGFLTKILGRKVPYDSIEGRGMADAHNAIGEALSGRIEMAEMIRIVLAAQVIVPLAGPPVMDGNEMRSWKPATVTKQDNGEQLLLAFTDNVLARDFQKRSPEHSYQFLVDAQWLLSVLPPGRGLPFNVGSDKAFNWNAQGISMYMAGVP